MREVLIALCGLTPQVVTETLWALARCNPPIHPAEVWIFTTQRGRKACLDSLLGPKGALARYAADYRLGRKRPRCTEDHIVVLRGANDAPLDDVRNAHDNQAVADQIADLVRRQTERPKARVLCSVAGGRKTMGILLSTALQFFGGPDDRLYHVLVAPEFEGCPNFFYPPKRPKTFKGKDGTLLDSRKAAIELAEVPYVRLRSLLRDRTLTSRVRLTDLVAYAERELRTMTASDAVMVLPARNRLQIGNTTVQLTPGGMRLFAALARIKTQHCVEPQRQACGDCAACYIPIGSESWGAAKDKLEGLATGAQALPADVSGFRSLVSKVNRTLVQGLGSKQVGARYAIRSEGVRNNKCYGLAADRDDLKVAD